MIRQLFCTALLGAAIFASAPKASAESFIYTTIDEPNATPGNTNVSGINNSGEVVGTYSDAAGNHGFTYDGSTFVTINDPADPNTTVAFGVTNNGTVAGYYQDALTGSNGFVESGGTYTAVNNPNGVYVFNSIQNDGNTNIWGISANGQNLAGQYFDGTNFYPFADIGGTFSNVGGTSQPGAIAYGVNNNGEVVGVIFGSDGKPHGFVDLGGSLTQIDDPNAVLGTIVEGVNDNGDIVGWYYDAAGTIHGFVDIGGSFTTIDDPNAVQSSNRGTNIWGINDNGEISGTYSDATGSHGFVATPGTVTAPESGTLSLLACGLLALATLAFFRRDRRYKGAPIA